MKIEKNGANTLLLKNEESQIEISGFYDGRLLIDSKDHKAKTNVSLVVDRDGADAFRDFLNGQRTDVEPCGGFPVDEVKHMIEMVDDPHSEGLAADFSAAYPEIYNYLTNKLEIEDEFN
jgi:hypothetical protein